MQHDVLGFEGGTNRLLSCDEELRSVSVRARIGHTDSVRLVMFQTGKLVFKFLAPDTLSPGSVSKGISRL